MLACAAEGACTRESSTQEMHRRSQAIRESRSRASSKPVQWVYEPGIAFIAALSNIKQYKDEWPMQ